MEIADAGYSIDVDPSLWVPVPLRFPTEGWSSAQQWAVETTNRLFRDIDVPDGIRGELESLAQTIAESESPLPEAEGRFWYFPVTGGVMQIVHLYATSRAAVDDLSLVEVAVGGRGEPEPQRADRAVFPGFDEAWRVILLGSAPDDAEQIPVGHIRFVGESEGIIVMADVTGTDLAVLGVMESHLAELFASIRVGSAGALGAPDVGSSAH